MITFLLSLLAYITGFFHAPSLGGGSAILATSTIETAQEAYFAKTGEYLQVLPGNKLPKSETGTVSSKIGGNLPAGVSVSTYTSVDGSGYEVQYTDETGFHSIGYGPQAKERTYDIAKPLVRADIASTTPL